jgi:hypothetical protein
LRAAKALDKLLLRKGSLFAKRLHLLRKQSFSAKLGDKVT